uniref:Uncharacterized protein n=1 Tax=Electrophorus electricus TaxID=8005 RepID=A0A4W4HL14_ELEEL
RIFTYLEQSLAIFLLLSELSHSGFDFKSQQTQLTKHVLQSFIGNPTEACNVMAFQFHLQNCLQGVLLFSVTSCSHCIVSLPLSLSTKINL